MGWKIIDQEESQGRYKVTVRCKRIRFFPIEGKGGETHFKPLAFPLLQVILKDEKSGVEIKVKCNATDLNHPTFIIHHPDKLERPTMIVGEGKRRREVPDMLAPLERVPGEKERHTLKTIEERLSQFAGVLVATEVMDLFAIKLALIEEKRLAA
jgi:hypothetical protein